MLTFDEIKTAVAPLAEEYGLKNVYLFGSYARGDQKDNSDIDLLVELGKPMGYFKFNGLNRRLEEKLNRNVDLCTPGSLYPEVADATRRDEVLIYANALKKREIEDNDL